MRHHSQNWGKSILAVNELEEPTFVVAPLFIDS